MSKRRKIGKLVFSPKGLRKIADKMEQQMGENKEEEFECFIEYFGTFRNRRNYKTLSVELKN